MRFLPRPPARKIFFKFRHCVNNTHQNSCKMDQKLFSLQILHLSSNRRVRNLTLYFQFTTRQESSPTEQNLSTQEGTNFGHTMFLRYLEPEKCQNLPRNSMNFSNAIILHYLEPAKCQKTNQKTRISYQTALINPNNDAKESICFS